jgi:hypothetical protein
MDHRKRTVGKDARSRYKLLTTLLTAYGLGLIAASALTPVNLHKLEMPNFAQIALFVGGLAIHGFALYIAPRGDEA